MHTLAGYIDLVLSRLTRLQAVALCALPLVVLLATALFAPLPFSVAQPGMTATVLGENQGAEVIAISGAPTRDTSGQLRMTFGSTDLLRGVNFLVAVIGLFGISEILLTMEERLALRGHAAGIRDPRNQPQVPDFEVHGGILA